MWEVSTQDSLNLDIFIDENEIQWKREDPNASEKRTYIIEEQIFNIIQHLTG